MLSYNTRLQPVAATDGTGLSGGTIAKPLFSTSWNWNFGSGSTNQNNGNLVADSYTHSGGGLASALTFAHSFSYDSINRLTAASEGSNWTRGFAFDTWGNAWVDLTRTSGIAPAGNTPTSNVFNSANNRISSGSYDAAGNQTVVNGNTVTYDAESRVRQVVDTSGTENILYDGNGDRIEKSVVSGNSTLYVYDAFGTLAAEYSTAAAGTYPCATCYVSMDQIGSTRLMTGPTGAVVARHDFLPFGEEITTTCGRTSQWGSTSDVDQKFTGQLRDTESSLDFFNARYYGFALNRFTSPDPANAGADPTNPQSWNGYAYVMNSPLSGVDPSGRDCVTFDDGTTGDDGQGTACPGSQTSQTIDVNGGEPYEIGDQTPGNVEYGFGLNFGRSGSAAGGGSRPGAMNLVYTPPNNGNANPVNFCLDPSCTMQTSLPGPSDKQRSCAAQTLKKNAVSLGLDVASLGLSFVPGGGFVRTAAVVTASIALTAPSTTFSAGHHQFAEASATFATGVATNPVSVMAVEEASKNIARALPILGTIVSGVELGYDGWQAYNDYQNCLGNP